MSEVAQVIELNQKLLEAIISGNWTVYTQLCSVDATCIEGETAGSVIKGLPFHKFYFDLPASPNASSNRKQVSMANIEAQQLGEDAVVLAYCRLNQVWDGNNEKTVKVMETRVWKRNPQGWQNVHVHRSSP